jgi:hypothetical protein
MSTCVPTGRSARIGIGLSRCRLRVTRDSHRDRIPPRRSLPSGGVPRRGGHEGVAAAICKAAHLLPSRIRRYLAAPTTKRHAMNAFRTMGSRRAGTTAGGAARSRAIATAVVPSVAPSPLAPRDVRLRFRALVASGAPIRAAGLAAADPSQLVRGRYLPTALVELFDTSFYLSDYFQTPDLRFFVAYVVQPRPRTGRPEIHPRIFYKDGSLVWRSASHFVSTPDEFWVGKGDVRTVRIGRDEWVKSVESTTDLPLEMQTALEAVSRRTVRVRDEKRALHLVLRRAPSHRMQAYADFTGPRRRAAANPRNRIHGGRKVAYLRDEGDPSSLVIVPGYEPDFRNGILERAESTSVLYCGRLERYRILSANRRIQYLFFSGPRQVWIIPPQATTTELSSYGVRTVDVVVDEEICCPGFEYHFYDRSEDPPVLCSQIPAGFAGPAAPTDPDRADAAPWLDHLPVIRAFRRAVLGRRSA